MTFREKLAQEHPDKVSEKWPGGCYGCPFEYGYEQLWKRPCGGEFAAIECRACWNRHIPLTPEDQHDLAINEEIIQGYCDQCAGKSCSECPAEIVCDQVYADGTSWQTFPGQIASPTKQRAMLDAFEAALPPEDDAPAEAAPQELPQAVRKLMEGRINDLTEEVIALSDQIKARIEEIDALRAWMRGR